MTGEPQISHISHFRVAVYWYNVQSALQTSDLLSSNFASGKQIYATHFRCVRLCFGIKF